MIPAELSEAFFHNPHIVLGIELQPFCLYHALALETIGSPFVDSTKPITIIDVERAVLICSIPLPETQLEDILYSYRIANVFNSKGKGPIAKWRKRAWSNEEFKAQIESEFKKFNDYIADFSPSPDVVVEQSGGQSTGAHWILSCAANVIKYSGWSKEYVFAMPVGVLYHFSIYFAASEGANIRFSSAQETGALDWLQSQGIKYQP